LILVSTLWASGHDRTPAPEELQALYDSHQWFELRNVVAHGRVSPFFSGAVAAAFNDPQRAKEHLERSLRSAPRSAQAYEAHLLLTYVYWRAGRYQHALAQLNAMSQLKPASADVQQYQRLFRTLSQFPEQTVSQRGHSILRYVMRDGNLYVPVSINGTPATYMVDTGANLPVISASEVKRRGLRVVKGTSEKIGSSLVYAFDVGDVAMADEVAIGAIRVKNVCFLILPDERFADIPAEQRGILGLPILLELASMRIGADGTFEIGAPRATKTGNANVFFDGAMPVAQLTFEGRSLDFALDTGAVRSTLYPRFAQEFAALVRESGQPGKTHATAVGGTVTLDSTILPEVRFRISDVPIVLRSATLLPEGVGSKWHYGNLGLDLLLQARVVTLDFRSMSLVLE
jgi:predicted aspartyl protease